MPLKVAFAGIDRYFERYYRKGPRRRPVAIDFCEADVLDVFDEWRRAVGLPQSRRVAGDVDGPAQPRHRQSLPAHLERVVLRLTQRARGGIAGRGVRRLIDRVARELESRAREGAAVCAATRGALIERLAALDRELLRRARHAGDDAPRRLSRGGR